MNQHPSWGDMADELDRIKQSGESLRACCIAYEGAEEHRNWIFFPRGERTENALASFTLVAAHAIAKLGMLPIPIALPLQHDPLWTLSCQAEEDQARREGKTIDLSDAVPYGLGEVDRDAVDPCTRAWLELLRHESRSFRTSEGMRLVKGIQTRVFDGVIPDVYEASAIYCRRRARDEIGERLIRRLEGSAEAATETGPSSPELVPHQDELPFDFLKMIPEPLRSSLEGDLRHLNAKLIEREIDKENCLSGSYDAFASVLSNCDGALTESTLTERIPTLVFETALEFCWLTRQQAERESYRWVRVTKYGPGLRIPEPTADLGGHRVQEDFKTWLFATLKGRIEHWRGVALKQSAQRHQMVPPVPTASGGDGLGRLGDNRGGVERALPFDFWESLRLSFLQLRADCAIDPPLKAAGRLTAIWTAQPAPGKWRLDYWNDTDGLGVTKRFEWHAQSAAARLGSDEKGGKAVWFWLDRLRSDAPEAHTRPMSNVGLDGVEELYSCELLDVCGLSAEYCWKCAADEMISLQAADRSQVLPLSATTGRNGSQSYQDDLERFVREHQHQWTAGAVYAQPNTAHDPTALLPAEEGAPAVVAPADPQNSTFGPIPTAPAEESPPLRGVGRDVTLEESVVTQRVAPRVDTHQSPLRRRGPVKQTERYAAIDNKLKEIALSLPGSHEDVFRLLDGRVAHAQAEPFKTARGWHAGFKKDPTRARVWLSKSWSRLGLPAFSRGPK
jgi:hypothetical protein